MRSFGLLALAGFWLGVSVLGVALFIRSENRPGSDRPAPAYWPAASSLAAPAEQPALVMFIHPECPCSRASLGELAQLMEAAGHRVKAAVLLLEGDEKGAGRSASADSGKPPVAAIPGVEMRVDRGGEEARKFGTITSGRLLLYGADGRLLFAGGITSSRGHAGNNTGREAVQALIMGTAPRLAATPVFGCPLFNTSPTSPDFPR